jgi:hypothetical protein
MRLRFPTVAMVLVAAIAAGCKPAGPDVHPVTGTLTIGGQPAQNVQIALYPADGSAQMATGRVDASGRFALVTGNKGAKGAMAGKYKVVLTPYEESSMEADAARYTSGKGKSPTPPKASFPKEYLAPDSSPKEVEVKPGPNTIDLAL